MAVTVISYDNSGLGTRMSLGAGDGAVISRFGVVVSSNGYGIDGAGGNSVLVQGTAGGQFCGIALGIFGSDALSNRLTVNLGGTVWSSGNAVELFGQDGRLYNHGTIAGDDMAIRTSAFGGGIGYMFNDGSIEGGNFGIYRSGTEILSLSNSGMIRGLSAAVYQLNGIGMDGRLTISNRGDIYGDIVGADAGDNYTSTGAGSLVGTFKGNGGDDTFRSGGAAEIFDGGIGVDTADYSQMSGVVAYLDGVTEGEGGANGDVLIGVETVIGSRIGADGIYGSTADNTLSGRGGNDRLVGNSGADTLIGGTGRDTLYGGAGNDRFVFNRASEAPDVIGDFSSAATGNNDHFAIKAAAFGGGLAVGALAVAKFWTSTSNAAHDATDRFIFRTTDKTLWFDADGLGGIGPVMIADMQASAAMTAGDILLI